jgi:hypothetical protein
MVSQRVPVFAVLATLLLAPRPGRAVPAGPPDTTRQEKGSLEERIELLDQQVRVLNRLRELDREATPLRQPDTTAFGRVTISRVVYGDYAAQPAAANIGNRDKTTLAALASYGAKEWFNVGKRGGTPSPRQADINELLIRKSRQGNASSG